MFSFASAPPPPLIPVRPEHDEHNSVEIPEVSDVEKAERVAVEDDGDDGFLRIPSGKRMEKHWLVTTAIWNIIWNVQRKS